MSQPSASYVRWANKATRGNQQAKIDRLDAQIFELKSVLQDALDAMEIHMKIKDPAWDGSATAPSAIGRARAALGLRP